MKSEDTDTHTVKYCTVRTVTVYPTSTSTSDVLVCQIVGYLRSLPRYPAFRPLVLCSVP